MDESTREDLHATFAVSAAQSSSAIMGIVALCNELVSSGAIDISAASRIGQFMVASIEKAGLSPDAHSVLVAGIEKHFAKLRDRSS